MSDLNISLDDYYSKKKVLIEKSIDCIIPLTCSIESMNHIVGKIDLSWDLTTLQKVFFDIIHKYLNKTNNKKICLSTCIFLEAAGNELEKFIPILSLPAFFETSKTIFQNITDWTKKEDHKSDEISDLDISIEGNVSIALLTLPSHNLLFHRLDLDFEKLLKLYESFTTNIFNSLFGNGLKLFWEYSKKIPSDLKEYYGAVLLLKKGILKFSSDLFVILNNKRPDEFIISIIDKFIENRIVAIQIERDLLSFKRIQIEANKNIINHFNPLSNFLFIHAFNKSNDTSILQKDLSIEYLVDLIGKAGSVEYANKQINEFKDISKNALNLMPIENYYKELLKAYCDYLVNE